MNNGTPDGLIIGPAVRRIALFSVLGVLVTAGAAWALPVLQAAPSDGTLTVKNADGRITIVARGGVIGRFDKGQVTIKDPIPGDGTGPIVTGAEAEHIISDTTTRYAGNDVRFRIIGGKFAITVIGTNVQLSVVATGTVTLDGKGTPDNGTFSVNGGPPQDFPDFQFTFPLETPAVPGGAGG
jgi:hypothetical protein